jgi:hypothetical protein
MREGGGVGFTRELLLTTFVDSDTYANEARILFLDMLPFASSDSGREKTSGGIWG